MPAARDGGRVLLLFPVNANIYYIGVRIVALFIVLLLWHELLR